MSGKQLLTSSSRSVKGALYGSLRRVGSIGKKRASRSKSVSNLQALFNPIDDSALTLSGPVVPAAPVPPLDKENSEVSLKLSLTSSSKNPVAPVDGDCPLSPLSPNSQKKRRQNYGGVKFNREAEVSTNPPSAKKVHSIEELNSSRQPAVEQFDSPARVASSPCMKKRDVVNAKPRTPKRRKSSEMRIYSDKGNSMIAETPGFRFEFGRVDTVPRVELEAVQSAPYRELFVGKPHQNWIALDDADNPVLVSILKDKAVEGADENVIRAIVRTAEGDSFVTHGALSAAIANKARIRKFSTKDLVKRIFQCELRNLRKIKDPKIIDELLKFEDREVIRNYKFGIVYVGEGQTKEEIIFANDETSPRFAEFLSVMGEPITLHGWQEYTGGLDTSSNLTGPKSIFTKWRDHNIMYHVAPMLPTDPKDPQRLEKKRHVGNDVIVIAFVDSEDTPFEPGNFRSHFNHIFVVVRPEKTANGESMYRIALATKVGVPGFGPELPSPALFAAPQLREFLLCKLINGERAVLQSAPAFAPRLNGARKETLMGYYKQFKGTV